MTKEADNKQINKKKAGKKEEDNVYSRHTFYLDEEATEMYQTLKGYEMMKDYKSKSYTLHSKIIKGYYKQNFNIKEILDNIKKNDKKG